MYTWRVAVAHLSACWHPQGVKAQLIERLKEAFAAEEKKEDADQQNGDEAEAPAEALSEGGEDDGKAAEGGEPGAEEQQGQGSEHEHENHAMEAEGAVEEQEQAAAGQSDEQMEDKEADAEHANGAEAEAADAALQEGTTAAKKDEEQGSGAAEVCSVAWAETC